VTKKSSIAVKESPTREERKEGVLPIKHAAFLHRAEESPLVKKLPEEKRAKKLFALAETIAELPRPEAREIVERFVMAPQKPMEQIKRETEALRSSRIELVLDPRVADGLRRAAEERKTTVEAIASLAIHVWLTQNKYN
jgi:hypothetical protein